ncbi:NTP transferase domain-containing protein [Allohahella marinimesophila]|uniref:MobA-like NTP transferase domain-containing protein n=1 Tax=Allohahella marinimesophila TaxID=1054972 RepID=A0ABP7P0R3_9GAMM
MQIIVPMSGVGQRFVDAGYQQPKPLIVIDGMPIIEHVINLFPGEDDFLFICNEEHIANTNMREVLARIAPKGKVITIPKHKLGPVYAVQQAFDHIDDGEVIVNYCDFGTYWDYSDFLKHTRDRNADGAVPSYKGFHPHMLGSTNYAFIRDENQWMLEIQEKKPFTNNRMQEYASNGTYYFKSGSIMKRFFDETLNSGDDLNGEFYVSVVFNHLLKAGLKVSIYEIQHMLQWGTPKDVEEFLSWSSYFRTNQEFLARPLEPKVDTLILPMAGLGSRFVNEGYELPKPLIEVNGKPMVFNAIQSAPGAREQFAAILQKHEDEFALVGTLQNEFPDLKPLLIENLTDGQASTCKLLVEATEDGKSIFIGACDNGMIWDESQFDAELEQGTDVLVWAFRNHPHANEHPAHYGWIDAEQNRVKGVSVKAAISDTPSDDYGVVGAFYFADVSVFREAYDRMSAADDRVNGELYVDTLINYVDTERYTVKIMPVSHFVCWGTPSDYETFRYWQSYFHKSVSHPYSITNDPTIPYAKKKGLILEYSQFRQENR